MEIALDAGADDVVVQEDGSIEVTTSLENFSAVTQDFAAKGLKPVHADMSMVPTVSVAMEAGEPCEKFIKLIDALEELDDVQNVYHNADLPES
jgi:transcriptional/translational regulatory protein YebC/TACO1